MLPAVIEDRVQGIVEEGGHCIGSTYDCAQFDEECGEIVVLGFDLYHETVDVIVKIEGRHVIDLKGVVVIGVLICPCLSVESSRVDGGYDIDMVVTDVGVGRSSHVVYL